MGAPLGNPKEVVVKQVELPGVGLASPQSRNRHVGLGPALLARHHAELAAQPAAALQEADRRLEVGIGAVVVGVGDAWDNVLQGGPMSGAGAPDDGPRELLPEQGQAAVAVGEDGAAVHDVVRRLEQAPEHIAGKVELVALAAVPMGQAHQRQVGELPVDLREPDSHNSISFAVRRWWSFLAILVIALIAGSCSSGPRRSAWRVPSWSSAAPCGDPSSARTAESLAPRIPA